MCYHVKIGGCHAGKDSIQNMFFSPAARMLAAQTIPSVYKRLGTVGIAFGEKVKYLDEGALENGLIVDISGARILQKMGIDVGLEKIGDGLWHRESISLI